MEYQFKTREEWMNAFAKRCRNKFDAVGYPLPENIRFSIGFPSTGAKGKRIGECWASTASKDGQFEIFVTPFIGDTSRIADIQVHEMVHAAVGLDKKHGKIFKKCATAVGLEGKMTATVAGKAFHEWAGPIIDRLGPIPHAELSNFTNGRKADTNRHIKCSCADCGTIFRMSRKAIDAIEDGIRCPNASCDGTVEIE
jgi:DNA-directed RNA polymerase subunit RPC12/RpoP